MRPSACESGSGLLPSLPLLITPKPSVMRSGACDDRPSLLRIVKNGLIDATRKEKRHKKHEVTESQIDARRKAQGQETDIPFLETIPSPEPMSEEPIDLKSLGLNIDELTPKELSIIEEVRQGLAEGYSFNAKQGNSLRVWWGKDYERKKKAFNRAKAKLTKH